MTLPPQEAAQTPSDAPPTRTKIDVVILLDEASAAEILSHAKPEHRPTGSITCVIARRPTKDSYNRYFKDLSSGTPAALVTSEFVQGPDGCAFRVAFPPGDNTPFLETSLFIIVSASREPGELLWMLEHGERGTKKRLLLAGRIFSTPLESALP